MNRLQIVQRVALEAGASGGAPSTTIGQQGEIARIVGWVDSAWLDLQLLRQDWFWLRDAFSFPTVAADFRYDAADAGITERFGSWDRNSLRLYQTSTDDEMPLQWLDYATFRSAFMVGAQTPSRPIVASLAPNMDLLLGPVPDGVYTASGEYFKSAQTLAADADTPEMPADFHMAIVYHALMMYARYESAIEVFADAEKNYKRIVQQLVRHQLPTLELGGALA